MEKTIQKNTWYLDDTDDYVFIIKILKHRSEARLGGCYWVLSSSCGSEPEKTDINTLVRKVSKFEREFYNLDHYLYKNSI